MADIHPVKFVYDAQGNVVALSEYTPGDSVPTPYLNLNINLDGGAITDHFKSVLEHVDGGIISDTYFIDDLKWNGGSIAK